MSSKDLGPNLVAIGGTYYQRCACGEWHSGDSHTCAHRLTVGRFAIERRRGSGRYWITELDLVGDVGIYATIADLRDLHALTGETLAAERARQ
jgi:hypothetical protein